jgi:hypothetical protein
VAALQEGIPTARVIYASATGCSEVANRPSSEQEFSNLASGSPHELHESPRIVVCFRSRRSALSVASIIRGKGTAFQDVNDFMWKLNVENGIGIAEVLALEMKVSFGLDCLLAHTESRCRRKGC